MKSKFVMLAIALMFISGCGTVSTVGRSDLYVQNKLVSRGTYCEAIPRMYSGVSFNFCSLFAEPAPPAAWHMYNETGALADFIFSALADTVVLPLTTYKQVTDGSIDMD